MALNFTQPQVLGQCQAHLTALDDGYLIHRSIVDDWYKLVRAARNDGVDIAIISSYRSFDAQLAIWNNKALGKRVLNDRSNHPLAFASLSEQQLVDSILIWSALPGASRHHWGCDIDIYSPSQLSREQLRLEPWEYAPDGPMAALGLWLDENLEQYGFFRPYRFDRGGVAIEPWHISHHNIASQAKQVLTEEGLTAAINGCDIRLKAQIIAKLAHIYRQYVCNICDIGDKQ